MSTEAVLRDRLKPPTRLHCPTPSRPIPRPSPHRFEGLADHRMMATHHQHLYYSAKAVGLTAQSAHQWFFPPRPGVPVSSVYAARLAPLHDTGESLGSAQGSLAPTSALEIPRLVA